MPENPVTGYVPDPHRQLLVTEVRTGLDELGRAVALYRQVIKTVQARSTASPSRRFGTELGRQVRGISDPGMRTAIAHDIATARPSGQPISTLPTTQVTLSTTAWSSAVSSPDEWLPNDRPAGWTSTTSSSKATANTIDATTKAIDANSPATVADTSPPARDRAAVSVDISWLQAGLDTLPLADLESRRSTVQGLKQAITQQTKTLQAAGQEAATLAEEAPFPLGPSSPDIGSAAFQRSETAIADEIDEAAQALRATTEGQALVARYQAVVEQSSKLMVIEASEDGYQHPRAVGVRSAFVAGYDDVVLSVPPQVSAALSSLPGNRMHALRPLVQQAVLARAAEMDHREKSPYAGADHHTHTAQKLEQHAGASRSALLTATSHDTLTADMPAPEHDTSMGLQHGIALGAVSANLDTSTVPAA